MSARDHPNHTPEAPMVMPPWLERLQIKPFARRLPTFGIVKHRGRTSGKPYETIVTASRKGDLLAIGLMHGKTNWVKNVLAAGEADVHLFRGDVHIINPRIVPVGSSGEGLPRMTRLGLKRNAVFVADIA
jgi:deazaflavin-dependent oxidoreductase (nitroreductase family)